MFAHYKRNNIVFNYFILFIFGLFLSVSSFAFSSSDELEVEEYSVTSLFTVEKLGEFLNTEGVVQKDRDGYIYITAPDYSSSILRWEGDYFYYANMYPTKSLNTVAKAIFREHNLKGWFGYGRGIFKVTMLASPDQEEAKYPAVPSVLAAINDGLDYENHHNILRFIVKEGSLGSIKYFLTEKKLDPNVQDSEGLTPLMLALQDGKDEIAQEFINLNNIDFEIEDNEGKTVLMIAKELGCTKIAKEIRRKIYKRQGWNDLMIAVEDNDVSVVIDLLARDNIDLFLRNDAGETAFMIAERLGYVEIAGRIQNKIYKIKGWTDLMIAASKNDFVWVKGLLVRGDDPLVRDKDGQNAFMIARKLEHLDTAEEIKRHVCEIKVWTELMFAVDANNIEMVRALLTRDDVDPTIRNKDGKTALNMAEEYEYARIVEEIKNSIFKKKGWDNLMIAVDDNDIEKVKELSIRDDIDLRRQNKEGQTSYDMAKEREYEDIAQEIKKSIYKKEGWTELMIAVDKKDFNLVRKLLARDDVDPKSKNNLAETAYMIAKRHDYLEIAEEIQNNIYKRDDYTDLMIAVDKNDLELVRSILADDDLDPNVKNKNGKTAYDIALEREYKEIEKEIAGHKNFKRPVKLDSNILKFALKNKILEVALEQIGHDDFDPNIKFFDGKSVVKFALEQEFPDATKEIVMHKDFDPNAVEGLVQFAIEAIGNDAMDIARAIINKKDYNPNVNFSGRGLTDLMSALRNKRFDFAMEIIKQDNFDPNAKNKYGHSPLSYALWEGQKEIAKEIIVHKKFDPNAHNDGLRSRYVYTKKDKGLRYVIGQGFPGIAKEIVMHKDFDPNAVEGLVQFAIENDAMDIARAIINKKDYNPNVNFSGRGLTDLMSALRNKRFDFAMEIIKQDNFDPNVKDKHGDTALKYALEEKHNDIVVEVMRHIKFNSSAHSKHVGSDEL